jgi:hypothetical protein
MTDEEIKTKRLSDWKPETDIKLQKAFGKFVEEGGELAVETYNFRTSRGPRDTVSFENELADCVAVASMIQRASGGRVTSDEGTIDRCMNELLEIDRDLNESLNLLLKVLGDCFTIIGRCQIQGLDKADPESAEPNSTKLSYSIMRFGVVVAYIIGRFDLDDERWGARVAAKIDSKLPWVMGTATDLLPDN